MANRALGINQAGFRGPPSSSNTASSEFQNKSRTPRFKVILDGHIAPNLIQKDVAVQLAKLTHTSTLHATQLLAGKPTTIKSDVSLDTAQRCLITLLEIGAIAHIEPISTLIPPPAAVANHMDQANSNKAVSFSSTPKVSRHTPNTDSLKIAQERTEPVGDRRHRVSPSADGSAKPAEPSVPHGVTDSVNRSSAPTIPLQTLSVKEIRDAINVHAVRARPRNLIDRISLYVITACALSLPFFYLASLMAAIFALQWHILSNIDWLTSTNSSFTAILYIFPILAGTPMIFLMAKPIIAPTEANDPSIPADIVKDAPILALVESVSMAMGTRAPLVVHFTLTASITVESRPGLMRYLWDRPIVTIGLPLVGELKTKQLVHLLAAELVRFSRHHSFGLLRLLEQVHAFLYQSAYETDAWDANLDRLIQRSTDFTVIALLGVKGLIAITRLPMALLSQTCQLLVSRKIMNATLDADRYACQISGTEDARSALTRQYFLNAAERLVIEDLRHAVQIGERIDNITTAVLQKAKSLPLHVINHIKRSANRPKDGSLCVYPSLSRRITALSAYATPSIVQLANPAIETLPRYDALNNELSRFFYDQFRIRSGYAQQRTTQSISQNPDDHQRALLRKYFCGTFRGDRFFVPHVTSKLNATATLGLANAIRNAIRDMRTVRSKVSEETNALTQAEKLEHLAIQRLGLVLQARVNYSDKGTRRMILGRIESLKSLYAAQNALNKLLEQAQKIHHHPRKERSTDPEVRQLLKGCRDSYVTLLGLLVKGTYPFTGGNNPAHILSYFQHHASAPDEFTACTENCLASVNAIARNIRVLYRNIIVSLLEIASETEKELGVAYGQSSVNTELGYPPNILGASA